MTPVDYQAWLAALEVSLRHVRPDVKPSDLDPNVMHAAFLAGESPAVFARRHPLPLRPAAPPVQPPLPGSYLPSPPSGWSAPPPAPRSSHAVWWILGIVVFAPFCLCLSCIFTFSRDPGDTAQVPPSTPARPRLEPNRNPQPPSRVLAAEIVGGRLEDFVTANGTRTKTAIATWRNTGNVPIAVAYADIVFLGAQGQVLSRVNDYTIFYAERPERRIPPGGVYTDPHDQGHIFLDYAYGEFPVRVEFRITRLKATTPDD